MRMPDKKNAALWGRRFLIYLCGLFSIALGVALSARSDLGISPVGAPANVLYRIGADAGLPENIFNLGNWTFALYCVYILAQILILGRRFRPLQFLQIAVSLLFGYLVNLAVAMIAWMPDPSNYAGRMLYLLASIPVVSFGVFLYLIPDLLPTPGEGMTLAMKERWGISIPNGKTIFDCSVVSLSVILSLAWFRGLVGVREGTVISALLIGNVMKLFQRFLQKPVTRFVWGRNE